MILSAFFAALGQIGDSKFRGVLFKGIGLTLLMLFAVTTGFVWWVSWLIGDSIALPFIGEITWAANALSWAALLMMFVLSVFLMVPVASLMTSIFLDEIAQAVEDRHYPRLPPVPKQPLSDAVLDSVSFLGLLIVANLAALVLYLIFSPLAIFIFWGMNGLLLGREYFTLAAMRREGRAGAKELRRKHLGTIWLAGTLMAIPLTVPILNLIIPILGVATFTHLYHRLANQPG